VGDALTILVFSLLAALNPTLLAAVTIMLLLPNPKRLMIGYLLGAYLTSITIGLLIVFQLHNSAAVSTAKRTLSPLEDLVIGALLIVAGLVLRGQRMEAGKSAAAPAGKRRGRRSSRCRIGCWAGATPGSPSFSASSSPSPAPPTWWRSTGSRSSTSPTPGSC